MKIQHLAVIFVLIILPIDIVLSMYLDVQINTITRQALYDTKLQSCVYDAAKVYHKNEINNTQSDIVTTKNDSVEASASTFLTSLQSTFGYSGYKASVMQEYVPAVVFTMYDGYYIYSKYNNTLTETLITDDNASYKDLDRIEGLKSYVYYSCRYKRKNSNGEDDDFVITYTLDNYITITGMVNGSYENKSGYIMNGITISGDDIQIETENGKITIDKDYIDKSIREEFVGDLKYRYTKINGTKYYLDTKEEYENTHDNKIFYMLNGSRVDIANDKTGSGMYAKIKKAIEENKDVYLYYKEARDFTNWVINNLSDLKASEACDVDGKPIQDFGEYKIFKVGSNRNLSQYSSSNFNRHRSQVIKYSIESNLSAAIAGFSKFSKENIEFAMPKLTETDWEIVENTPCVIGFLQGLDIGTKKYNGYALAKNSLTKEFVDEDSIYFVAKKLQILGTHINQTVQGKYYYRFNTKENIITNEEWNVNNDEKVIYIGVNSLDFEQQYKKEFENNIEINRYYYPYNQIASYSSIIMQSNVTQYEDVYKFIGTLNDDRPKAFYIALAQERYGSYKVDHDMKYEYYLKNY